MKNKIWKQISCILYACIFFLFCAMIVQKNTESNIVVYPIVQAENENEEGQESTFEESGSSNVGPLSVTFYDFGDGDCTLIQYQDVDILVDVGDKGYQGKVDSLKYILKGQISDGVLEYFIVTHPDSDHIYNAPTVLSWFNRTSVDCLRKDDNTAYKIENIVDFDSKCKEGAKNTDSYRNYKKARDNLKETLMYKPIAEFWGEATADGSLPPMKEVNFPLGDGKATLHFLYNAWYFNSLVSQSHHHNCMSVCLMVTYGKSKVLLTGDMSEVTTTATVEFLGGETSLLESYGEDFFNKTTLFKAAHHGSRSSNSEKFMAAVKPQYVMIPCLASSTNDHKFPSQGALDNFLRYTDKIFISSYEANGATDKHTTYYGDTTFYMDAEENVVVHCPYANKAQNVKTGEVWNPIMETEWFKENRTASINTYVFSGYKSSQAAYIGSCSLVKYGSTDILIDCGTGDAENGIACYLDKIAKYCVDGVLEMVIVSAPNIRAYRELADFWKDNRCERKGIISTYKIDKLIDFGEIVGNVAANEKSVYNRYLSNLKEQKVTRESVKNYNGETIFLNTDEKFSVSFLESDLHDKLGGASISCTVDFYGEKLLFTNFLSGKEEKELVEKNKSELKKVVFYKASWFGSSDASTKTILNAISSNNLHIAVAGVPAIADKTYLSKATCERLYRAVNSQEENICLTSYYGEDGYVQADGDIVFTMGLSQKENGAIIEYRSIHGLAVRDTSYDFLDFYRDRKFA